MSFFSLIEFNIGVRSQRHSVNFVSDFRTALWQARWHTGNPFEGHPRQDINMQSPRQVYTTSYSYQHARGRNCNEAGKGRPLVCWKKTSIENKPHAWLRTQSLHNNTLLDFRKYDALPCCCVSLHHRAGVRAAAGQSLRRCSYEYNS